MSIEPTTVPQSARPSARASVTPLIALSLACVSALSLAQTPPPQDAGSIRREAETLRPPSPPPRQEDLPLPERAPAAEAEMAEAEETLFVRAFRIEDAAPLEAAEVEAALAPYAGRALTMAEINAAVRAVTLFYQARGFYLAQASLPPQDAREGTLRIQVTVGRYGAVRLHNRAPVRETLLGDIFSSLAEGEAAQRERLERALLLTADLPGASLPEIAARPGQQPGTMDVEVVVPPGKRLGGFVVYDNQGSRYTGRNRLGAGVDWNSPLGLGDRLSLSGVYGHGDSRHTGNARLAYALPLVAGLRLDAAIDHTSYALGDQYEALEATGTAESAELGGRHALLRTRNRSLEFGLRFATRHLRDDIDAFTQRTRKRIDSGTLDARFEQWGRLFGYTARGVAKLAFTTGRLHFRDEAQRAANRLGANTEGNFRKLVFSGVLDHALSHNINLNAELTAQWALGKSLDGSEQISITGVHGAGAYRESISADNGYTFHVEGRYLLPSTRGISHSVGLFANHGRGWFERPAYVLQNGVTAADAGLAYSAARGPFFLKAQVAHKIGARPDERLAKRDGDTHLLLQLGFMF